MRMTINQLGRKPVEHVVDGERSLLLRHFRIEKNLQKKIAEFARELVPIAIVDRFEDFVGLLKRVWLDGVEALLAVPGASARRAQPSHDRDGALEAFSGCRGHRFLI